MAPSCQALGAKQKIFLLIAVVNVIILAVYQGFFSEGFSALASSVGPAAGDQIRSFVINGSQQQGLTEADIDIHYDDPKYGHSGQVSSGHSQSKTSDRTKTVAIGGGITSKGIGGLSTSNVATKFQYFYTLLPSFCVTASQNFHYHFYLAYDQTDGFFNNINNIRAFTKAFQEVTEKKCPKVKTSLHLVQCTHNARPAWAQNDAMFEAYIDGIEYYYRVNDDSDLSSGGWTEAFISTLAAYKPSNIGVVGPKHRGGNEAILTYDFVHKTHVDIFGFYYPRLFTDWWADDWVTKVYQPGRSTKLPQIKLVHTMKLGQRYKLQSSATGNKLAGQLTVDKVTLQRYIKYAEEKEKGILPEADGTRVISMSLYGRDPLYTYGAIRNAQLLPVHFPGWTLRFYVAGPNASSDLLVPNRILDKLRLLGSQIATVSLKDSNLLRLPSYWRYFIADDERVERFLIRDVDARLSDREYKAVQAWEDTQASFHCIKDHPKHASATVVDGLWGAKSKDLRKILQFSMQEGLKKNLSGLKNIVKVGSQDNVTLLTDVIWNLVQPYAVCHDSVSCDRWPQSRPFPVERSGKDYIGQRFDAFMNAVGSDASALSTVSKGSCTGKGTGTMEFPTLPPPGEHHINKSDTSSLQEPQADQSAKNKSDTNIAMLSATTNQTVPGAEVVKAENKTKEERETNVTVEGDKNEKDKQAGSESVKDKAVGSPGGSISPPGSNTTAHPVDTVQAPTLSSTNQTGHTAR